ncbi:NYN domain-containing protein [Azorhizobium doebereinerae]|uniref:NYN domain-containing protein n=1 Tax=Azorhizobium doebereinerae TaxID=281091 RepID=UPI000A07989F|nr:NYN domain-containing protein [Azorhizobium doebereinerae]
MTTYSYIDNSNIYIEGCRLSAVRNGFAKNIDEAMCAGIIDHSWNLDYGNLYEFICGSDSVARLWGSPPPGDSFWNMLHRKGFNTTVYERNAANKEKKVDTAIAGRMTKDAYTLLNKTSDEIILVAGDSDYVPIVADLVAEGFKIEVAFWDHASSELRRACSKFISLNKYHEHLTL